MYTFCVGMAEFCCKLIIVFASELASEVGKLKLLVTIVVVQ